MLTRKIMVEQLMRLSTIFKCTEGLSDLFYNTYYSAISKLSDEAFMRGVQYLVDNYQGDFFPKPAELFQAVRDSCPMPEITPKERQIEVEYPGCPDEVKQMRQDFLEKMKKRGMK